MIGIKEIVKLILLNIYRHWWNVVNLNWFVHMHANKKKKKRKEKIY